MNKLSFNSRMLKLTILVLIVTFLIVRAYYVMKKIDLCVDIKNTTEYVDHTKMNVLPIGAKYIDEDYDHD